jgi:meiotic recombination protein SPO11
LQSPTRPHRPILGVFDCDPDGIKILDVYRNGSRTLAHESAYNVPEMKWLGLTPTDAFSITQDDSAVLSLTARDVTKITTMLGSSLGSNSRTALQWMRLLNRKAEIQLLEELPGGVVEWLAKRIEQDLAA